MKIALLGAESTGKSRLAEELAVHLRAQGKPAAVVAEYLREWCQRECRTPRPEEQMPIAQEQERRVDAAAAASEVVITDTTALMVAIYSAMLFEDGSLYQFALARQRTYDFTLLTGLDVPWEPDGLQRDGPHVREPVDEMIRAALAKAGVGYRVIYGTGAQRLANAVAAIEAGSAMPPSKAPGLVRPRAWQWSCEKCGDPDCEHRLFTQMLEGATAPSTSPGAGRRVT